MKTKSLLLLLIGCYFLVTCDDGFLETAMPVEMEEEEEEVVYPLKYTYAGVDFQPTEFYTYQIDSFEQIVIDEGIYASLDSLLFALVYDTEDEFVEVWPFREIELLNDTLLRMEIRIENNPTIDTSFNYSIENEKIVIEFYGGEAVFELKDDLKAIRYCSQTWGFNYFNDRRGRREPSPLDNGDCETDTVNELLFEIIDGLSDSPIKIQQNDTFYVNISYQVLDLEG